MKRGLAHLLESAFSTFEMRSLIDPVTLRQRVFACQPSLCLARRAVPPRSLQWPRPSAAS